MILPGNHWRLKRRGAYNVFMTKIFLAGIIQGSQTGRDIHDQQYRRRLRDLLERVVPGAEVYCPVANHPNSIDYDRQRARGVFLDHLARAADADIVVAFLPEASMRTAIEIWQAHRAGRIVFTISPLTENWVIKLLATRNFATLDEFERFTQSESLQQCLDEHGRQRS